MIVEFCKDTRKRQCQICKHNINKGQILVKYEVLTGYGNCTNMNFYHIDCLIKKLNKQKEKMENIVPKYKVDL